ncbi:hypothetical protein [Exiguobacterium sp. ERU656]|nr:hypothetical protein [Exiguobacterium sp. ERU656]
MKSQVVKSKSLDVLKEIVTNKLSSVGVKKGASKPGDGRYSALLKSSSSK